MDPYIILIPLFSRLRLEKEPTKLGDVSRCRDSIWTTTNVGMVLPCTSVQNPETRSHKPKGN